MEITIPLLEPYTLEPEPPEPEIEHSGEILHNKKSKGGKGSKQSSSKNGSKKGGKKGKNEEDSPYAASDEYENEIKARIKNTSFKTERQPWEKIIQFPDEALSVTVPNNIEKKLALMRDAFRTVANVKAIFTQVLPPPKPGKKDKKDKIKNKKDKGKGEGKGKDKKGNKSKDKKNDKGKGKKDKAENDKSSTTVKEAKPEPEPTETIVKKITLANFNCELHVPKWRNKTIDYYWCKHPKFSPNKAVEVEGSLRNIFYTEAKKTKKGKGKDKIGKDEKDKKDKKDKGGKKDKSTEGSKTGKKGKGSKSSISSKGSKEGKKGGKAKGLDVEEEEEFVIMKTAPAEDILPDLFTVQVGFGLKRTPPERIIVKSEEMPAELNVM